jgi:hypothetical protein
MLPQLGFTDVCFLFAVGSILLLITAELSSSFYGQTNLKVDRQKLKNAAYAAGVVFLIIAVIRIVTIL